MAYGGLLVESRLTEAAAEGWIVEERIVTEALITARLFE
jgi:hypothetical protein